MVVNRIYMVKFGSHLYGTDTPDSDLDLKSIYIPSARDIILGHVKESICVSTKKEGAEKNKSSDIDNESFSLKKYLSLLMDGQTVALDMLFAYQREDMVFLKSETWDQVWNSRSEFITSNAASFVGYCMQQAAKYGIKGTRVRSVETINNFLKSLPSSFRYSKLGEFKEQILSLMGPDVPFIEVITQPDGKGNMEELLQVCGRKMSWTTSVKLAHECFQNIEDSYGDRARLARQNMGVDRKALSHAVRVINEAKELITTGHITFPRPDRKLLLEIKTGVLSYDEVAPMIENGIKDVEVASEKSNVLRKEPNRQLADDLVYEIYRRSIVE